MSLTDLKIQSIKQTSQPQKIIDGDGLYLYITTSGTKSWRIDYRHAGKRYTLTIGKYPLVSLAKARIKRSETKQMLLDGINPNADKKAKKETARSIKEDTFKGIATDWYDSKSHMRSDAWRYANKLYLERDLYPYIGKLGIREITPKILLDALEKCATYRGHKTADRIRGTALQVFEFAIQKLKMDANPALRLKNWAEIPKVVNRPHLKEKDIHEFIDAMDGYPGLITTKLAAKLLWLTFVRKTELVQATWDEIDLANAKWTIPAERMKMNDSHVVPLSKQAIKTLNELLAISSGSKYVFPSESSLLKPMSRASLNRMFANMENGKYKGIFAPHGIRSTASTWLNEKGYASDLIERQLAHTERNRIRAAYNHADWMQQRRDMLSSWAEFLFPSVNSQTSASE